MSHIAGLGLEMSVFRPLFEKGGNRKGHSQRTATDPHLVLAPNEHRGTSESLWSLWGPQQLFPFPAGGFLALQEYKSPGLGR